MSYLVRFAYYNGLGSLSIGFGFLFNLYFGLRGLHYGMVIIGRYPDWSYGVQANVFYISCPVTAGYGSTFLGLHFYTWSLIISVLIMAAVAVALAINSMNITFRSLNINPALFSIAGWVFLFLITSNLISTVLECGGGECAANPVLYNLLSK
ncbi:disulfide bond formation protein [Salmonella enterica subsp. indica]|uniref:Disulfide bond formation protein n=1 Tax=Salmonella enterica subsp. indica TaxID=59207 RepID=A0A379YKI1_SALER|nr:disulfide bond formation protein [Salmonella enterica subsp. indica]